MKITGQDIKQTEDKIIQTVHIEDVTLGTAIFLAAKMTKGDKLNLPKCGDLPGAKYLKKIRLPRKIKKYVKKEIALRLGKNIKCSPYVLNLIYNGISNDDLSVPLFEDYKTPSVVYDDIIQFMWPRSFIPIRNDNVIITQLSAT